MGCVLPGPLASVRLRVQGLEETVPRALQGRVSRAMLGRVPRARVQRARLELRPRGFQQGPSRQVS